MDKNVKVSYTSKFKVCDTWLVLVNYDIYVLFQSIAPFSVHKYKDW